MTNNRVTFGFVFVLLMTAGLAAQTKRYDLGHAAQPRVFAPGVISTEDDEGNGSFSPDGKDFYFTKVLPYTTFPRVGVICVSHLRDGQWSTPEVTSFSGGQYLDATPRVSPDGTKLFFTSSRSAPGTKARPFRVWVTERTASGWSDPVPLPAPINSDKNWNWNASVTRDGTLYFASDREARFQPHLYRSKLVDGKYAEPEKLGPEINANFNEADPFVAPDESYLIFVSSGVGAPTNKNRPETLDGGGYQYPRGDLYISFNRDGHWSQARHLEHGINTVFDEVAPSVTPDGKYLFFGSERSIFNVPTAHRLNHDQLERGLHTNENGHGNIYYVDISALGLEIRR